MNRKWLATPYMLWIALFTLIPMGLIVYYALSTADGSAFTLSHISNAFSGEYLQPLLLSLYLAAITTLICLLIAYPLSLILVKYTTSSSSILFILVLPMWMNFLLRTYAWLSILEKNGLLNKLLHLIHLPSVNILYTQAAVILGMVYNFLPFMIMPVYNALSKIDQSVIEASHDLGANDLETLLRVKLPLSIPGVMSGITMVFMPSVTTFVIPNLLGGGQVPLIGSVIERQFLSNFDWHFGSSLALILMVIILLSMFIMSLLDRDKEGVSLW